jgi:hypothetical protein
MADTPRPIDNVDIFGEGVVGVEVGLGVGCAFALFRVAAGFEDGLVWWARFEDLLGNVGEEAGGLGFGVGGIAELEYLGLE